MTINTARLSILAAALAALLAAAPALAGQAEEGEAATQEQQGDPAGTLDAEVAEAAGGEDAAQADQPAETETGGESGGETPEATGQGEAGGESDASDTAEGAMSGDAPEAPSRFQPIADLIEAGGAVIVILAILSIIGLMLIGVKLVQFTVMRVGDHRFVEGIWAELREGHPDEALDIVARRKGVVARVMETALHAKSLGGDTEAARQEVERVAKAKLDGLERGLPLLSLIATVSPLLGLLGTVLGMIEAFQQMETAGDSVDPAILSGGIWEALLTTAAGLSVAIPAAAFYTWLQRSVDVAGQHMEDAAVRVFTASLYATVPSAAPKSADD